VQAHAGAQGRARAYVRATRFFWTSGRKEEKLMETTTCAVQHHGQQLDGVDGLLPPPTNIKEQMPQLASTLQWLSGNLGRESVVRQLKASMDLRKAYDADDYRAVNAVYKRGHGWIDCEEGGFCVGVPRRFMEAFAKRHRGR
jgi:hypothetical protein